MPHSDGSVLPPGLGQAGLLAQFIRIAEEDLARDREYALIGEGVEQRRQEVWLHPHIAIEQDHDVVLGRAKAGIRSAPETEITFERQHTHGREVLLQKVRAAVLGPVIHNNNFVVGIAR